MKLMDKLREFLTQYEDARHRDRRAWYASEITKDARDLFWRRTGVPETNPGDIIGKLRMGGGKAIEKWLMYDVLGKMHFFGLHIVGSQTKIGGSEPVAIDGDLDGLLVEREGDEYGQPYVLEIKTKWGYGAKLFCDSRDPGEAYMSQMGYYLRDLSSKGVTNRGMFLFMPMGDSTFGDLILISCKYDAATDTVTAYESQSIHEEAPRPLDISFAMGPALQRLKELEGYIERNELPPADKQYKYPLTPELLDSLSDSNLRAAAKNEKVIGDWSISYSDYKYLHIKEQGGVSGYTQEELDLLNNELAKRFPQGAAAKAKKAKAG
jgi:hypothetical protein